MKRPNIRRALGAAKRVVVAKAKGQSVLLDADTVNARLKICAGCPKFDKQARQCLACTCFVDVKASLSTENCPESRWPTTNR